VQQKVPPSGESATPVGFVFRLGGVGRKIGIWAGIAHDQ